MGIRWGCWGGGGGNGSRLRCSEEVIKQWKARMEVIAGRGRLAEAAMFQLQKLDEDALRSSVAERVESGLLLGSENHLESRNPTKAA